MKNALEYIVTAIVNDPKSVVVLETDQDGVKTFVIKVAKEDMGKIIGKEGKVIRAIRNVMKIPAIKQNERIQISLEETA